MNNQITEVNREVENMEDHEIEIGHFDGSGDVFFAHQVPPGTDHIQVRFTPAKAREMAALFLKHADMGEKISRQRYRNPSIAVQGTVN